MVQPAKDVACRHFEELDQGKLKYVDQLLLDFHQEILALKLKQPCLSGKARANCSREISRLEELKANAQQYRQLLLEQTEKH